MATNGVTGLGGTTEPVRLASPLMESPGDARQQRAIITITIAAVIDRQQNGTLRPIAGILKSTHAKLANFPVRE